MRWNRDLSILHHARLDRASRRATHAFTLIELLLASFITVLLLGATLIALSALGRDRAKLDSVQAGEEGRRVFDLIRRDLARSARVRVLGDGSVCMDGQAALDPDTLEATGRSARVIYRVYTDSPTAPAKLAAAPTVPTRNGPGRAATVPHALGITSDVGRTWLVREQLATDETLPHRPSIQFVVAGVASLNVGANRSRHWPNTPSNERTGLENAAHSPIQDLVKTDASPTPSGQQTGEKIVAGGPAVDVPRVLDLSIDWADGSPPATAHLALR